MSYRGQDLDLRLPPGRQTQARGGYSDPERPASSNGARYRVKAHRTDRSAPLWVDDTVLAVCNAAYEVAQALHSSEVLLQHLVHGMTRVAGAVAVLEQYGVDQDALRREVTALISSTAISTPDSIEVPTTSSEFKAALRIAGDTASRRDGEAISVEDLLEVLMHYDNDHPGVELLLNHIHGRHRRDSVRPLDESLGRSYPRAPTDPFYTDAGFTDAGLSRPPTSFAKYNGRFTSGSAPAYEAIDQVYARDARMPTNMMNALDAMESRVVSRLMTLENNYRDELRGFQSDRKVLAELVQQLHADVTAHRSETLTLRDGLSDQLKTIERVGLANNNGADTGSVMARLQGLERTFEGRLEEVATRYAALGDQMRAVELAMSHQSRETAGIKEALSSDMKKLGEQLLDSDGKGLDLDGALESALGGALGGRLDTIETLLLERDVEERGDGLSHDHMATLEALLGDHYKQITMSMNERERSWTAVNERLNKLEHLISAQNETTENAAGDRKRLLETINARMAQLEQLARQQGQSSSSTVAGLKTLMTQGGTGPGNEFLLDLKNSIARISGAQQTTAEVFDQWRLEMTGDLSVLNERLEQVQRSTAQPVAMLDSISADLRSLQIRKVEKPRGIEQHRGLWDGFSNWLFGPR